MNGEDEEIDDMLEGLEDDLDDSLSQATQYEEEEEFVVEPEGEEEEPEDDLLSLEETETPDEKVERLVAERLANSQVQQQRQPTQEEVLAQLKHYVPDETVAERLGSEDIVERLAAMREMVAGMYGHLYAVNEQYGRKIQGELQGMISPLAARALQQEKEMFVREVGKQFPSLKGKEGLVAKTMVEMGSYGYKVAGKTNEQILKDVALATGRAIKEINPSFTLTMRKSGKNPSTSQGRVPTRGGGGGAGRGKAPAKGAIPFHERIGLFGKP